MSPRAETSNMPMDKILEPLVGIRDNYDFQKLTRKQLEWLHSYFQRNNFPIGWIRHLEHRLKDFPLTDYNAEVTSRQLKEAREEIKRIEQEFSSRVSTLEAQIRLMFRTTELITKAQTQETIEKINTRLKRKPKAKK